MNGLVLAALSLGLLVWAGRRPARVQWRLRGLRAALDAWRRRPTGGMSASEARSILGVGAGATRGEIDEAYRRLMRAAHPDAGGTTGLAAQLNAARDRLKG